MLLDIGPMPHSLALYRLFARQLISGLSSMGSDVVVPQALQALTHANAQVGLLGSVPLMHVDA
jgi:hypothetical protein